MKLGIGGGVGPFRAGISTRGLGVRVDPFKATTGYGRRRRNRSSSGGGGGGAFVGFVIVAALTWYAFTWPWYLATNYEKHHGNRPGSAGYNRAGWTAEIAYLTVL